MKPLHLLLLLAAALLAPALAMSQNASNPVAEDPYLWLEDVEGARALAWVRERNAETERVLQAQPGFAELRSALREVFDSRDEIPHVWRMGPWLYNLWKDGANPRGLWRRTTLEEFRKPRPQWHTVLDLDALGKAEGTNWTWAGASCLAPEYRRCMVGLSRGGADAAVRREFDLQTLRFVDGGFVVPEAKSSLAWADADTLYVASDFGPGSLTESGYPRTVRRWQRGQPLQRAATVFEADAKDMMVYAWVDHTPGHERTVFAKLPDIFSSREFVLQGKTLVPIDKPDDTGVWLFGRHIFFKPRTDWTVGGATWPAGSLLVADAAAWMKGQRSLTALFTPSATRSLDDFDVLRDGVLINVLDNVASRLQEWRLVDGRWESRDVAAPFPGKLSTSSLHDRTQRDDPLADAYLLNSTNFLQPDSLSLGHLGSDARELLKQRPSFFDSAGMRAEQRFATSQDGTRVPYFIVWPKDAKADGDRPTLLYGYGGFEQSMTPAYSGGAGRAWLARGGVYVIANIRGGGEFGPAWHRAAIGAHKQRSYDDFAAVAADLIATKVTRPARLGMQGGSNGGLLVGAVMLQHPELFGAVVCQVPLLDMRRYHLLLAGASWMAEYGNPDVAEDWAVISRYSPYQNLKAGSKLPPTLFVTSTRDDRVHPGHARKMAARMLELGNAPLYWENIEGGHGGAADNAQRAQMWALQYAFLWQQLGGAR